MPATESASYARVERAIEKLTEATTKQTETLHQIQLEQVGQKAGIAAINKTSNETRGIVEKMLADFDSIKDKVTQLDGILLGDGNMRVEHNIMKATIAEWGTFVRMVKYFISPTAIIGAIVAVYNLIYKVPVQ